MAAAPIGFASIDNNGQIISDDTVTMLPRHRLTGKCRLCGVVSELTKEHIPPKSSGNKLRHTKLTFDDWIRDHLEPNMKLKHEIEQGGIFGYTLCEKCNSMTGNLYGTEYMLWVERAKKVIDVDTIIQLDKTLGPFGDKLNFGNKDDGGVKPGAFVRQVLSCMCSLSGPWDLAEKYPVLRRIILQQSKEKLPAGMELGMTVYFGPNIRIHGPQLKIDWGNGVWRWCQEIAFPPFAFLLILASNIKESGLGLLIDNFTELSPQEKQNYTGLVEMGFGWTPYPGDYRSKAKIIADRSNKSK